MKTADFVLCIHGGAGTISRDTDPARVALYRAGLSAALQAGLDILRSGGTALDAVEAAVVCMEDNPCFNAGRGAVYNAAGQHELDSCIMDGYHLACGALAGVSTIRNPIKAARRLMETSPHILLAGHGADTWAEQAGLELVNNGYFDDEFRHQQWLKAKESGLVQRDHDDAKGTVGAVALDAAGNLAAATSTGGMTNKQYGRVGDTPLVGCGTYANNAGCAVSCTGTGEQFIRHVAAHAIHSAVVYGQQSLEKACQTMVQHTLQPGDGGLIAVDRQGNWQLAYNSAGMFRGVADSSGLFRVAIWED
ncbi:MAG: isoaspartyl peptidase/L-asparaginase [Spirochaetes bacterium]|nr:isoaspartyl peptidase/L-asparaginase [Spirochaetota bacterium]MBU0954625.1 isoaspartyl peptidase/L-asparaginase [Spirochaetota bacterium]